MAYESSEMAYHPESGNANPSKMLHEPRNPPIPLLADHCLKMCEVMNDAVDGLRARLTPVISNQDKPNGGPIPSEYQAGGSSDMAQTMQSVSTRLEQLNRRIRQITMDIEI